MVRLWAPHAGARRPVARRDRATSEVPEDSPPLARAWQRIICYVARDLLGSYDRLDGMALLVEHEYLLNFAHGFCFCCHGVIHFVSVIEEHLTS